MLVLNNFSFVEQNSNPVKEQIRHQPGDHLPLLNHVDHGLDGVRVLRVLVVLEATTKKVVVVDVIVVVDFVGSK